MTKKKLQKVHFSTKKHCLLGELYVHFEPLLGGNVHRYSTTKEMKTMAFRVYSQNIEQAFGIQVTFIREIKLQKEHFLAKKNKKNSLFGDFCFHFKLLLGWKCADICRDYITEKDGI